MKSYFEIPATIADFYIQSSLRTLQAVHTTGEQTENLARMALDHGKTVREEGLKFVQRWAELGRESHRIFIDTYNNAINVGFENYRNATQKTMTEMTKQVDRISKQAEAFAPPAPPVPAGKASKG